MGAGGVGGVSYRSPSGHCLGPTEVSGRQVALPGRVLMSMTAR